MKLYLKNKNESYVNVQVYEINSSKKLIYRSKQSFRYDTLKTIRRHLCSKIACTKGPCYRKN